MSTHFHDLWLKIKKCCWMQSAKICAFASKKPENGDSGLTEVFIFNFLGDSQYPPLARLLMWRWWWHFFSLRQTNSPRGPIIANDTSKWPPGCEHDYRQVWIDSDAIWKFGGMETWKKCKFFDLPCHLWLQKTKKRWWNVPTSSYMHLHTLVVILGYTLVQLVRIKCKKWWQKDSTELSTVHFSPAN